ncbi:hypothetical protein Q1695_014369 [Nippostrongylus brasiliensis]|nr:hypothetical protein Q1695_014369 [Nippostrongylus brasiliensis]
MNSFSYSRGSGAVLSLKGFELKGSGHDKKPFRVREDDLAVLRKFDAAIDDVADTVFSDVLTKIGDFFKNSYTTHKPSTSSRLTPRKLNVGIVQCNVSDLDRITNGVRDRLDDEAVDVVVLKSGDANVFATVSKIRSGKGKQLLVVEQGENLSSQLVNGLFYSLQSLHNNVAVLLCLRMSTKLPSFYSMFSRRVLAALRMQNFSPFSSEDIFERLVSAALLNPKFTPLKFDPTFIAFLRSVFFRDDFSIAAIKKCIRFAILRRLFSRRQPDIKGTLAHKFEDGVDEYMKVLRFLQSCLYNGEGEKRHSFTALLELHEQIQLDGFPGKLCNTNEYGDWMHSLKQMTPEEFSGLLQHEGIADYNIKLTVPDDDAESSMKGKDAVEKPLGEVKSILHLKEMMKKRMSMSQRNPQNVARQKAINDLENTLRNVLRPFSSLPHSDDLLVGADTVQFLRPDICHDIEESILTRSTSLLAIALHALSKQGRWKTVSLSEWGKTFAMDCKAQGIRGKDTDLEQMFFACVGQFEIMGIIRGSADRRTPTATIAHHVLLPVS